MLLHAKILLLSIFSILIQWFFTHAEKSISTTVPRILVQIGNMPPVEFEQAFYRQQRGHAILWILLFVVLLAFGYHFKVVVCMTILKNKGFFNVSARGLYQQYF
jgi:hypothetical protein